MLLIITIRIMIKGAKKKRFLVFVPATSITLLVYRRKMIRSSKRRRNAEKSKKAS